MPRKSKTTAPKRKKTSPYPSLLQGPTPAERLARYRAENPNPKAGPMTEEEFDKFLEEVGDVWPEEEDMDEFIAWLRKARRTGRYD